MKASELKLPALVWDGDHILRFATSVCPLTGGVNAPFFRTDGKWESYYLDHDELVRPFDPATDKLPARCKIPDEYCYLAKAPEKKWRAWKHRSEVPVNDVRLLRWNSASELTGTDYLYGWYMPQKFHPHGITINDDKDFDFEELFDRWEYSPDGREWFKCGVQEDVK